MTCASSYAPSIYQYRHIYRKKQKKQPTHADFICIASSSSFFINHFSFFFLFHSCKKVHILLIRCIVIRIHEIFSVFCFLIHRQEALVSNQFYFSSLNIIIKIIFTRRTSSLRNVTVTVHRSRVHRSTGTTGLPLSPVNGRPVLGYSTQRCMSNNSIEFNTGMYQF